MIPRLVSVVVPVYNHARFLERCLESVVEQDGIPRELVVVDDGSSDGSYETARRWADRRGGALVRCEVRTQPNAGLCPTLNRLVDAARGEYVLPMASDDYLLPGGIRRRVEALERNPRWLAVLGDCVVVDGEDRRLHESAIRDAFHGDPRALADGRFRVRELVARWTAPGPGTLLRRSAYDVVGRYDERLMVEDRDFFLRLLARNVLGFVPEPVAAYRLHGANTGRDPSRFHRLERDLELTARRHRVRFAGINRAWLAVEAELHGQSLRWVLGERRRSAAYLLARLGQRILLALHERALRSLPR